METTKLFLKNNWLVYFTKYFIICFIEEILTINPNMWVAWQEQASIYSHKAAVEYGPQTSNTRRQRLRLATPRFEHRWDTNLDNDFPAIVTQLARTHGWGGVGCAVRTLSRHRDSETLLSVESQLKPVWLFWFFHYFIGSPLTCSNLW